MNRNHIAFIAALLGIVVISTACKKDSTTDTATGGGGTTYPVPAVYSKIYGASSITSDGTFITIKTNGLPDYKSVYYPPTDPMYEAFSGTTFGGNTFVKNPNTIAAQNYTFKIPLNPVMATTHVATPLGAMGVAINGIPLYNQYAAPNQPLTTEVISFDKYWGHPTATSRYHYHVEPLYLTTVKATKSSLLGFLLDGFPVYGPEENGAAVTNAMLDAYHGHTHATADFPNGTYHYHINNTDPYINGSGYYGTPGTATF
ncbi:YHYH protein [Ferruginibacter profundus]